MESVEVKGVGEMGAMLLVEKEKDGWTNGEKAQTPANETALR